MKLVRTRPGSTFFSKGKGTGMRYFEWLNGKIWGNNVMCVLVSEVKIYLPIVFNCGTQQFWHGVSCLSSSHASSKLVWSKKPPSPSRLSSFLLYSMAVRRTTSANGTIWQRTSQMSIILMSEVGGSPSILLMKMVVITSMVVRFTLRAASKKKGLKKVVAKVMAVRRTVGK